MLFKGPVCKIPHTQNLGQRRSLRLSLNDVLLCHEWKHLNLCYVPSFSNKFRCETFTPDDKPEKHNYRAALREILLKEDVLAEGFLFELQQNFMILDKNSRDITLDYNAEKLVEAHLRACLHAGVKISEVEYQSPKFSIEASNGLKACDDLIIARFLIKKIKNDFGIKIKLFENCTKYM